MEGVKGRERRQWSGCAGCIAEGAVDVVQVPIIQVHDVSLGADASRVVQVHTPAASATFPDTLVPFIQYIMVQYSYVVY